MTYICNILSCRFGEYLKSTGTELDPIALRLSFDPDKYGVHPLGHFNVICLPSSKLTQRPKNTRLQYVFCIGI